MKTFPYKPNSAQDAEQTVSEDGEKAFNSEVRLNVNSKAARQGTDETVSAPQSVAARRKSMVRDFKARGEPFLWLFGGGLCVGIAMIIGFIVLIV